MAKLTKQQAKAHQKACAILAQEKIYDDEAWKVFENWNESAHHINSLAGAFFTPVGLARDFSLEVTGRRIIDLCAGIGVLGYMASLGHRGDAAELVCVEANPDYVEIGRKLLPEATWICGSVFDLPADLGRFDVAIANPPFGATQRAGGKGPRYSGNRFEYHVIDIASDLADYGAFIIPQASAPFQYSGVPSYRVQHAEAYEAFKQQTGIQLEPSCGIDCDYYRDEWRGVAPAVEVVVADFQTAQATRSASAPTCQRELFTDQGKV